MKVIETKLPNVYILEPKVHKDHRGFFMETYNKKVLEDYGINFEFIQDNHSLSVEAGTIRGLHYQLENKAQTKLVRVIRGAIFDVAVDIRKGSSTYGKWVGAILSEDNKRQLVIPKGFAHGFCTLVSNTEVHYKVDEFYSPEHDRGILWNDPEIGIYWPTSSPILSDKDSRHLVLSEADNDFKI
ncbi:dTDP-4-dehydrorhamnose 3,5-epimerase [Bacillus sp. RG28]|uniref:dTDP-4-dehydrorhamnose 3,5-epimerase n=1 Tax=Gottfriedia endophytica TaxID=2820819 RepID=A0A940NP46_9BACI|nr:dTDP-4-dehydrorhamnose 3,5-epimerase [Gottfriedia endophytica]MBP0725130.1 dTDP-4-dehydrorhamnose 3,5-epimerase [Gottfriedia endophytica]